MTALPFVVLPIALGAYLTVHWRQIQRQKHQGNEQSESGCGVYLFAGISALVTFMFLTYHSEESDCDTLFVKLFGAHWKQRIRSLFINGIPALDFIQRDTGGNSDFSFFCLQFYADVMQKSGVDQSTIVMGGENFTVGYNQSEGGSLPLPDLNASLCVPNYGYHYGGCDLEGSPPRLSATQVIMHGVLSSSMRLINATIGEQCDVLDMAGLQFVETESFDALSCVFWSFSVFFLMAAGLEMCYSSGPNRVTLASSSAGEGYGTLDGNAARGGSTGGVRVVVV